MTDLSPYFIAAVADAAAACRPWIGQGDKEAADQAAVEAMRTRLQQAPMDGRIVIGEGERDEAPMLHIGEALGAGGPAIDVAVDPLEGTNLCAENQPGAICVLSYAPHGDLLHAPDIYMDKIAAGPGLTLDADDMDRPIDDLIRRLAKVKGAPLRVLMLDRPRHAAHMAAVKAAGASLSLIPDGDVMASLQTALPQTTLPQNDKAPTADLYIGTGGAPEGVLAASGLQHLGGTFIGRLNATTPAEQARADRLNMGDLSKIYSASDLATPSSTLVMAGVTSHVLAGVRSHVAEVLTLSAKGLMRQDVALTP